MKTVLFDLDDTLIRHNDAIRGASEELFAQVLPGRSQDCNEFVEKWISANASWYRKFYDGQVSFQESGRGKLRESFSEYGCVFSDRTADALLLEYWERYVGLCQLFDDVLECLGILNEYKVGVITNGQEAQQINKLKRCGIFSKFDVVVTSQRAGAAKPSAEIFVHACEELREFPSDCIYIGDNLKLDAIAATKAGMLGVWLEREQKTSEIDLYDGDKINSLLQIPMLLAKLTRDLHRMKS
ncbi:HAD family hydrolase [uncultured Nostoc sp.]|uniref:HAD family hydrolase n=1 Tax=uncultured Nostoc sp. TaxID=340711 RepID=UPI0035CB0AB6